MRKTRRMLCRILFLVTLFGVLLHAQMPAGPNRPMEVPEDYVITPFGYLHPSCVFQLGKGDLLADGQVIEHADGTVQNVLACGYPQYTAHGEKVVAASGRVEPPTIGHSWVEYASASTSSSYGEISAQWDVPMSPTSNNGQTVYFFPGFEDYSYGTRIIQPVLGWNAFSGFTQWSIASWNYILGNAMYSSPVSVAPGDIIGGYIKSTCAAGTLSCPTWNITTTDYPSGQSTTLSNSTSGGQTFNWGFAGVLEVYNLSQCSNYPSSTSLTFSTVALYDYNFSLISNPGWSFSNVSSGLTPQCNYGGSVTTTQTTLNYGTTLPQTAAPTLSNVQVTTNGGGQSGTNYVFTMTISDTTFGATVHYSIAACGQFRVLGSTSPGQFVYRCTGHSSQATLYMYALASGQNPSTTAGPFNF